MCQNPQMALFSDTRAWELQGTPSAPMGLQSPYLLHTRSLTCSLCLAPATSSQWANRMGNRKGGERTLGVAQSTAVGSDWGPSERAWEWMWALNHRAEKWTTAKLVYLHSDNATSLQHILQYGSHNQELEWLEVTSDDMKIAVEAVVQGWGGEGKGGSAAVTGLVFNYPHIYFIEEISLWSYRRNLPSFWKESFEFSVGNSAFL